MKKTLFILIVAAVASIAFGQLPDTAWVRRYNSPNDSDDVAYDCAIDNSHNIYVAGYKTRGSSRDVFVVKYNQNGDTVWTCNYPAYGNQNGTGCALDNSGNLYVVYNTYSTAYYGLILKINALTGDTIWSRRLNRGGSSTNFFDCTIDSVDNIYVAGMHYVSRGYGLLVKYSPNGDTLLSKVYNSPSSSYDLFYGCAIKHGTLVLSGYMQDSLSSYQLGRVYKCNLSGDTLWSRTYGEAGQNQATAGCALTSNGDIYVVGQTVPAPQKILIIKYSSYGDTIWTRRYSEQDGCFTMGGAVLDSMGNVYTAGFTWTGTLYDVITVKYSAAGGFCWAKKYDSPFKKTEYGWNVARDGNDVVVVGYSENTTNKDFITIKYKQITPALVSPISNSYLNQKSPTVLWRTVPSATAYRLQVSADSLFNTFRSNVTGIDTFYQCSSLGDSTYYWRVKTYTATDSSGWSETWKFNIYPWAFKNPMPYNLSSTHAAVLNGKIYFIGGSKAGTWPNRTNFEYNPQNDTWSLRDSLPTQRWNPVVAAANNKIFVIGGCDIGGSPLDVVEVFDPALNAWSTKTAMPIAKGRLNGAAVNGKIYVIGGWNNGNSCLNSVNVYNPAADTTGGAPWSTKTAMPTARSHQGVAVMNGKIYVAGGATQLVTPMILSNVFEVYDPVLDNWTALAPMPAPRAYFELAALGGKIYALGGKETNPDSITNRVFIYDPTANAWSIGDSMLIHLADQGTVQVNNRLYAFGGSRSQPTTYHTAVEEYYNYKATSPTLAVPRNNDVLNNKTPSLSWNRDVEALNYRLQVSTDSLFYSLKINQLTATGIDTSYATPVLGDSTYYWRVKAYGATDSSGWSQTWRFTVFPYTLLISKGIVGSGDNDLYTMTADSAHLIYNDAGDIQRARWNNDRNKIVFTSNASTTGKLEVFLTNADGSNCSQITTDNAAYGNVGPDFRSSQKIWYSNCQSSGWSEITEINYDGSGKTKLTNFNASGISADYGCDVDETGNKVYYYKQNSSNSPTGRLYRAALDFSGEQALGGLTGWTYYPQLSYDKTQLCFMYDSANTGSSGLWKMNTDGNGLTRIGPNAASTRYLSYAWSRDGARILYSYYDGSQCDIYVMNADGTNKINLTNTPGINEYVWECGPATEPIGGAPNLLSPASNVYLKNANPTLIWSRVGGASQYRLQISVDSAFASARINSMYADTSALASLGDSSYYWRVKAYNTTDSTAWSAVRKFDTRDSTYLGLLVYYPLNGNIDDASGNGHRGNLTGAMLTADRFGNANHAYSFDGINDAIYSDTANAFATSRSIVAWVKSRGNDSKEVVCIKSTSNDGFDVCSGYADSAHANAYLGAVWTGVSAMPYLNDGQWHMLGCSVKNDSLLLYCDDRSLAGIRGNGALTLSLPAFVSIGKNQWTGGNYFNGQIDEIRVYDRVLSASDLVTIYHEGGYVALPILTYPSNNAQMTNSTPTFAWHNVDTGISYTLQIGTDSLFAGLRYNQSGLVDTTYHFVNGLGDSTYWWRVKAYRGSDSSLWSDARKLRIINSLDSGLVVYYPYHGNAGDSSGHGLHGTPSGSVSWGNDRFNAAGSCASLSATDALITTADNDLLDLQNNFSISVWFKESSANTGVFVITKHQAGTDRGCWGLYSIYGNGNTGKPLLNNWVVSGTLHNLEGNACLTKEVWQHVVYTFNKQDSTWSVYVQGNLNKSGKAPVIINNTTNPLIVGNEVSGSYSFQGAVDDIRIYNRTLTQYEVKELFYENGYSPIAVPSLIHPGDNHRTSNASVSFLWNKVAQATAYHIQVSTNIGFSDTVASAVTASVNDTAYSNTFANSLYFWKVRAISFSDSSAWSPIRSFRIDNQAPGAPSSVVANGQGVSAWTNAASFSISLAPPSDPSGIGWYYAKKGMAPTGNADASDSSVTVPFAISATAEGGQNVFIWAKDSVGNVNYQNTGMAVMRWDSTRPSGCVASSPQYSSATTFPVTWTQGSDAGGSGLSGRYDLWVKVDSGAWSAYRTDTMALGLQYQGAHGHSYYFEALSRDSAGNIGLRTGVPECSTAVDTLILAAPTLAGPDSGWCTSSAQPRFSWNPVAGTDTFQIQVSASEFFGTTVYDQMVYDTTGYTPGSPLITDSVYYWRVRAHKPNLSGSSAWSRVRTFRLDRQAPGVPAVYANGQTVSAWTSARSFAVSLSLGQDASGISRYYHRQGSAPTGNGDYTDSSLTASFAVNAAAQGGSNLYLWARDNAGNVNYQNAGVTALRWDTTRPTGCVASSPSQSRAESFMVSWSSGSDAGGSGLSGRCDLWVSVDGGAWSAYRTDTSTLSLQYPGAHGHFYRFEALARDSAGNIGIRSGAAECSTAVDTMALSSPTLCLPVDAGITNSGLPSFVWRAQSGADTFRIQSSLSAAFGTSVFDTVVYDTSFVPAAPLALDTVYYWRVRALRQAMMDSSSWSSIWTFRRDTLAPGPVANLRANGTAPSAWTRTQPFTVSCDAPSDVSGIARYLYKIGAAPITAVDTTGSAAASAFAVTATTQGGQNVHVWARDNAGNANYAGYRSAAMRWDTTRPAGSAASSNAVSNTLAFAVNWSAGSDAGGSGLTGRYDLWVKANAGTWSAYKTDTAATGLTFAGIHGNIYYFEALARDSAGNAELQTGAAECSTRVDTSSLLAPALISPANGSAIHNEQPPFRWSDLPGVGSYRLQLSADPAFGARLVDTLLTGAAFTPAIILSPDTIFHWRVKGYKAGLVDSSAWAEACSFRLDTNAPQAPAGVNVAGNNPSPWQKINAFAIDFTMPADASGIRRYLYKRGAVPTSNFDTTGTFTTKPMNTTASSQGGELISIWAEDNAGNVSYGNRGQILLRYDNTPPFGSAASSPDSVDGETFTVRWSRGSDAGGAGMKKAYTLNVKDGAGSWALYQDNIADTSVSYTGQRTHKYCFEVAGTDSAGNIETLTAAAECSTYIKSIPPDVIYPVIASRVSDTLTMPIDQDFTMNLQVTDNRGINYVKVYYNRGGERTSMPIEQGCQWVAPDTYRLVVPGMNVTGRGLQYKIEACDSSGNISYYPSAGSWFVHPVYLSSPQSMPDYYPNDQWRMFSLPFAVAGDTMSSHLNDDLGPADNTKWRLFEFNTATQQYREVTNLAATSLKLGRAYWLKHRKGATAVRIDCDSVCTYSPGFSTACAVVPLDVGWNDIANPYPFNVSWRDIKLATGADTTKFAPDVKTYLGTDWSGPLNDTLGRWAGYSLHADSACTLRIPPYKPSLGKGSDFWPAGWVATISIQAGSARDNHNYFGIGTGTRIGKDRFDLIEPPAFFSGVKGAFRISGSGDEFSSDLRPELGTGQTWNFLVQGCDQPTTVTMALPIGIDCYLCDETAMKSVKASGTYIYQYQPEPGEIGRNFKLVVGSDAYAQNVISKFVPTVTLLEQNKPNPFSGKTVLTYQLSSSGRVRLTAYNMLGQQVRALVNAEQTTGRYSVVWDGRDGNGRTLASGVYFLRLESDQTRSTKKAMIIQ